MKESPSPPSFVRNGEKQPNLTLVFWEMGEKQDICIFGVRAPSVREENGFN